MMPKFVSSSGQVYAKDKHKEEEDEILASIHKQNDSNGPKKPAAVNKKGTREKPKSSLELFKEELQRLNEEREEQRKKFKSSLSSAATQHAVPIPLKPDPRCPTTLTLQVNLNPKAKDAFSSGSFDTGDPTTTNLYIGNLNPIVTENELCDIFGKFGPLASIKIMWPRTDEERARNRNSGFVAYMSRIDGERALRVTNGMDYKGYDMKLGWGKAVPLPKNPVFVPAELVKLLAPPPRSGLPFNAQLHSSDLERGYKVPEQVQLELESQIGVEANESAAHEFSEVLRRATVQVCVPQDRIQLDRIHKTIEYVMREGPVFESIIMAREASNPEYRFLHDYDTPEHVYYRWKLYSLIHGDGPYAWSTGEFRMYLDGPLWRPPPINPFADGMPIELVERLTGIDREVLAGKQPVNHRKLNPLTYGPSGAVSAGNSTGTKGFLNQTKAKIFDELLADVDPTKTRVGAAMLFCINHSYAAEDIIAKVAERICSTGVTYKRLIGLTFLISDILHNSSAQVSNASYYREGFRVKLVDIFQGLKKYLDTTQENHQAERFKKKIVSVLGSWKYYQLYEDDFVLRLSKILFGQSDNSANNGQQQPTTSSLADLVPSVSGPNHSERSPPAVQLDDDLDGDPIDENLLAECLEAKGLSLRWYKTLELSDDECEEGEAQMRSPSEDREHQPGGKGSPDGPPRERFKVSKWELISEEPERGSPLMDKITPTSLVATSDSSPRSERESSDTGTGSSEQRDHQ